MYDPVAIAKTVPTLNVNLYNYKDWRNPILSPGPADAWDERGIARLRPLTVRLASVVVGRRSPLCRRAGR